MQACDELFSVDDALWLYLIDVCLEHCLKGGAKCFLRELKIGQYLLHFCDCYTSTALCVRILQCIVKFHRLQVHFCDIYLVEEQFVLDDSPLLRVELFEN